jgi:hypothetical protein
VFDPDGDFVLIVNLQEDTGTQLHIILLQMDIELGLPRPTKP